PIMDLVWAGPDTTKSTITAASPHSVTAGAETVTVTVKDPSGAAITGVSVVPTLTGVGQLLNASNLVTNSQGQVTFTFDPENFAGNDTISALIDGNVTISTPVVVTPVPVAEHGSVTLDTPPLAAGTPGNVTITGLPTNLDATSFNGGTYAAGTWTGTATQ